MVAHARRFAISLAAASTIFFFASAARTEDGAVRRVTHTPPGRVSLNPSVSGDGRRVAFESNAALSGAADNAAFGAYVFDIDAPAPSLVEIARSRAPAPAVSQDGSRLAFASTSDATGFNRDGNSEIFYFDGAALRQLTDTRASDASQRASQGSFQPSMSDDGTLVAFASNRDHAGRNADGNSEIFIYDTAARSLTQLTDTTAPHDATDAKLCGDGSRLAFTRNTPSQTDSAETEHDLVIVTLADGAERVVAHDVAGLSFAHGRAFSDDGARVVFAAEDERGRSQVYLFDGRHERLRQLTSLGARASDVPLHPTVSGDGSRVAFATRRSVIAGANPDASVELYLYDLPSDRFTKITNAPANATGEVVSSLDDAGATVAFSFPRALAADTDTPSDFANNPEVFVAALDARAPFGDGLEILNGAALDRSPAGVVAPGSIAIAEGNRLALDATEAARNPGGTFPFEIRNTTVSVNNRPAQMFFASPDRINFLVPPETESGDALVSVRNHDGFEFRGVVRVARVAPGLFTHGGTGAGASIALDADTLGPAPFDALDDRGDPRRLILFATGARHSSNPVVTAGGRRLKVEAVVASPDLPGLDQIHVRLSSTLKGAGTVPLVFESDGATSNPSTLSFTNDGPSPRPARIVLTPPSAAIPVGGDIRFNATVLDANDEEIIGAPLTFASSDANTATVDEHGVAGGVAEGVCEIQAASGDASAHARLRVLPRTLVVNEILADPPDGSAGDANRDGVRSGSDDEFVELVNATDDALSVGGWTLRTRALAGTTETVRHRFAPSSTIPAGDALVVFGGGDLRTDDPSFGGAQVIDASTNGLSLTNAGLTLLVRDASGNLVTEFTYGLAGDGLGGDSVNQSITRAPDISGAFVRHTAAAPARRYSPGVKADGAFFVERAPVLAGISIDPPSQTIETGTAARFTARAFDQFNRTMRGLGISFDSSDTNVATVADITNGPADGLATAHVNGRSAGTANISATATHGDITLTSDPATLSVVMPTPTPTPTPSSTPTPIPSPSPSPTPSPSPSPTPPPTPTPSPAPTPAPGVVISQVYGGGGNSGATFRNDFIELFNRGNTTIDLNGWSVQYAGATGTSWQVTALSGSLAPGQFYLIEEAAGTGGTTSLPTPDATGSIAMAATAGKVALVNSTTALSGACPSGAALVDFVGYGSANCAEGATAPAPSNTTAVLRKMDGCVDSGDNSADFSTGPPAPRNRSSPSQTCAGGDAAGAAQFPIFNFGRDGPARVFFDYLMRGSPRAVFGRL